MENMLNKGVGVLESAMLVVVGDDKVKRSFDDIMGMSLGDIE